MRRSSADADVAGGEDVGGGGGKAPHGSAGASKPDEGVSTSVSGGTGGEPTTTSSGNYDGRRELGWCSGRRGQFRRGRGQLRRGRGQPGGRCGQCGPSGRLGRPVRGIEGHRLREQHTKRVS